MVKETSKSIIIILLAIVLGIMLWRSCTAEPEIVEVPITIEVPIPVVEVEFDTIREPIPIYVPGPTIIDSTYYKQYLTLKDSIAKDSLFRDAIIIREYKETVEDDTITINVYAKVQGNLKDLQIGYKTKPRNIILDTILKVPVKNNRFQIGLGLEAGIPTNSNSLIYNDPATGNIIQGTQDIILKGNLSLHFKKIVYHVGYDTGKRVWAGVTIKF